MTAAKAPERAWISGYCNPGNPAESHARCHLEHAGTPCRCTCHVLPEPTPAAAAGELHGFIDTMPEQEYHTHPGSLSHSGAKLMLRSPAHYQYRLHHPEYKDVFDFGSAAHAEVLGVGVEIVVHDYDPEKVKSPKATNAWKTEQTQVRERGAVLLLPEEYAHVCDMAEQLASHRLAMELLSNGRPEVSAFAPDEETGILRRGRFDWLGDTIPSDYKTAVSSDPDVFVRTAANYGYHSQHGWYLDLARDLGHPAAAFAFIVQEKEPPYVVTVIELPADLVQVGRNRNRTALQRFRDCTESDLWPGYRPDTDFARPTAPPWALREQENAA